MIAKMIITEELQIELLHLPKDTRIVGAWLKWRGNRTEIHLKVSHPEITTEEVNPMYEKRGDEEVKFIGWNYDGAVK